jgi:hypothetical protein
MKLGVPDDAFRAFGIDDFDHLDAAFRRAAYRLCEYSYATQFCWRTYNESRWAALDDWILVRYREHGQHRFLCPIGPGNPGDVMEACFERLAALGSEPRADFVPDSVRTCLAGDDRFRFDPDPANDDYVYLRSDLANLAGKKYARKRNHVSRFLRNPAWSFDRIDAGNMAESLVFLDEWCRSHGCEEDPRLDYEVEALRTCLLNMEPLRQTAYVLRVGRRIVGLTLGELQTPDTFVVHYEKAYTEQEGAYQMLAREFARTVPETVAFIDREQDMGVEGLRQSKLSFIPDHFEHCWIARPRDAVVTAPPEPPGPAFP